MWFSEAPLPVNPRSLPNMVPLVALRSYSSPPSSSCTLELGGNSPEGGCKIQSGKRGAGAGAGAGQEEANRKEREGHICLQQEVSGRCTHERMGMREKEIAL